MTLYDSSVIVDYLDGDEEALAYVKNRQDERAVAPPLVLYEVYQGEVYKSGESDFDAVDRALEWLVVVDETREHVRTAAELQAELVADGSPLAARDALVAGTARALGEGLAVADSDFDVDGIRDGLDVDFV